MDTRTSCAVILMHVIAMFFFNSPDFIREVMPRAPRSVASMAAASALATRHVAAASQHPHVTEAAQRLAHRVDIGALPSKECARALHAQALTHTRTHARTHT